MTAGSKNRWMRTTLLHGVLSRGVKGPRVRQRGRRLPVVVALSFALTVPAALAQVAQAQSASGGLGRPSVPGYRSGKLSAVHGLGAKAARAHVASARKAENTQAKRASAEQTAAWPMAGTATADLSAGPAAQLTTGGLPVRISRTTGKASASGQVRTRTLSRAVADAAGIDGVLFEATAATPGSAQLSVDYRRFASALGGGWAGRLRLVQLPSCVLAHPDRASCRKRTPLSSHNDLKKQTLSADVKLAATPNAQVSQTSKAPAVFAAVAQASGGESPAGAGNYAATPLSASSTWAAGGSSGSFTWSYPLSMPPAAAGPSPSIGLSYDSSSVDGKTATTNNQTTQLGEGFALSSDSYISRSYGSCDDDGEDGKNDECWKYDNASLVLNGQSSELVKDDTTHTWHLKNDDASTVTHSTGADNGDEGDSTIDGSGEYWTVTTGDGTQYVFGLNKLPGAGDQRTNSVWTVPVFGDDSGEPGYSDGTSFADRSLNQAWRWNLDYVVDVHGNAMTYWYTPETNYYAKNGASTANASYTRAGTLDKILYGQRKDTLFTAKASDEVDFTYAERCFTDCSSLTKDTADHWPDVPFDSVCAKDADDCYATGPSFFTRKRLTTIETSAWLATSSTYDSVDKWDFTEEFLDPGDIGDTSDQSLVLDSIVQTGEGGSDSAAVKPVSFTYRPLPNRVDATDDILPLSRYRIDTITSETGAITTVTLDAADCVRGSSMPAAEDDNNRNCFPQYWHINGAKDAALDWFQKYPVEAVLTTDPAGNGEGVEHAYDYADPGWAYNDDPFTPQNERTWSSFRGFGKVTETTGAAGTTQSKTVSVYMLGMNGDKRKDSSATRSASVAGIDFPGLDVPDLTDTKQYAGFTREQITYNGSTPATVTVNDPWSKKTATQHKSYADIEAYYVRTGKTSSDTYLTVPQTWRTRTVSTTYDSYGMASAADDTGDTAKSGDEACTRTWYARNPDAGLTSLVSRSRTVARPCSVAEADLNLPATSASRGDVLSDSATVYDDTSATAWTASQTPTKGEATWTGRPTGYPALASNGERNPASWQTVTRTTFDDSTAAGLGRPVLTQDAESHPTTLGYTPTSAGPTTETTATNIEGQKAITDLDPERGNVLKTTAVDGKITESTYDALGRVTATWLPNRRRILHQAANYVYTYHPDNGTTPSWESTGTLKADGSTYNTSYAIYDSLLRPLQTQSPTPNGGRLLTDTRYDSRGLAYETYADVFDQAHTPSGTYQPVEYGGAPKQTETVYDGAGRATTSTLLVFGVQKWSTTTTYTGDSTAVTGLNGGSATRTITDALGHTTEQRQYVGTSPADTQYGSGVGTPYTRTAFTSTFDGKPSTITGPDSSHWTYTYDMYGRQISATDPDTGTTTTGYTDLDQVSWTKDAEGRAVISAYDDLGRPTGTWSAPASADLTSTTEEQVPANQLTAYTYDSVVVGQPTSSTRYVGGSGPSGTAYATTVTAYDSMNRATATQLTLPSNDALVTSGAVPSTLNFSTAYNIDGTQQFVKTPAAGGLPAEQVGTAYDDVGLPTTMSGTSGYVNGTSYSPIGEVSQLDLATSAAAGVKHVFLTNTFQDGTDRLTRSAVTDQTHAYELQDLNYTYDDTGNVTSISDPTVLGGTGKADDQCFTYDGYQRMTEAWTPATADCSTTNRTVANLGGASPYWTSYTYTAGGLRSTQTDHTTAGSTLHTYCYNAAQPHALTAVIASASCTGAPTQYTYDSTGNTVTRPQGTGTETLGWNAEDQLDSATVPSGTTTDTTHYVYGPDGNVLIRRDATGETVLYLDGITEVHLKKSGSTTTYWAQRSYAFGGACVAVRTNQPGQPALSWMAGDQHGTSSLAVNSTDQTITKRYSTPFGAPRPGSIGTWPDDKGFLGKPTDDTTGLTYVGARAYDPKAGRFMSVDPQLNTSDGQSLNGYAYADNNPVTLTDPSGTQTEECATGALSNCSGGSPTESSTYNPDKDPGTPNPDPNWIDDNSPSGTKGLSTVFAGASPNQSLGNPPAGGYWHPQTGAYGHQEVTCFGLLACSMANQYLMKHPKGYAAAKAIAATYCIANFDKCQKSARNWYATKSFGDSLPFVLAAGVAPEAAEIDGAAGGIAAGESAAEAVADAEAAAEADAEEQLAGCSKLSFDPDTLVLMGDGTTEPIGDLRPGEKVQAADPDTGKHQGPRTVTATLINHDHDLVDLTVETSPGHSSVLHTTAKHPFWDDTTHHWVPAGLLTPGHALETDHNTHAHVLAIRPVPGAADMYNLTVDQLHTYYVLAGTTPVLVHNSLSCDEVSPNGWPKPTMDNCKECAQKIQDRVGGQIYHVKDSEGAPRLGPSTNDPNGSWTEHYVVIKDGTAYDAFTGPEGMPMDQYRAQWQYGDYLSFTPYNP